MGPARARDPETDRDPAQDPETDRDRVQGQAQDRVRGQAQDREADWVLVQDLLAAIGHGQVREMNLVPSAFSTSENRLKPR